MNPPTSSSAAATTRRRFLKSTTTAATAALVIPQIAPGLGIASPANGKLSHASIGVGGMGWNDLRSIASHPKVHVTAICDIDATHLKKAADAFPGARRYTDWRELLAKEGDKIDSVNVTTPDHMHAPIAFSAIAAGKNTYCQKPLTHTVYESRQLRLAAEKAGVVTQMGNQIQSAIEYRMAVELIQSGVIGKITGLHAWSGASFTGSGRPVNSDPVPESVAWDNWLGVAPARPYVGGRVYHPFEWRRWRDFGGGGLGDFGCHILDTPFKALDLTQPVSITAREVDSKWFDNPDARRENWPAWEILDYEFPGTRFTKDKTLRVTWYDGAKQPPLELFPFGDGEPKKIPGGGALFIGESGALVLPHVGGPRLLPREANRNLKRPKLEPRDHYHSFVDACLANNPAQTTSNFSYAGNLAELVNLGNIACQFPGQSLNWNHTELNITNIPGANSQIRPHYRNGWHIEGLG